MPEMKHSLHEVVEKWLGALGAGPMRKFLMRRSRTGGVCCVSIRAQRSADVVTLLFFRHERGDWQVFPPQAVRPAMRIAGLFK